jgi:Secretion system C-terminal sorting domain
MLNSQIMNKLYPFLLVLFLLIFSFKTKSQNTCATPYLFETGNTYNYPLDTGVVNQDSTINYSCYTLAPNPLWLYFGICTPGDMILDFQQASSGNSVSFTVWGPLSDSLECNGPVFGCSLAGGGLNQAVLPGLQSGYYKIVFTSPSSSIDTLIISQIGGTAIACQTSPCFGRAHEICYATTDLLTNQNVINWQKHPDFIGDYNIQKESNVMGVYDSIGTVSSINLPTYSDNISNPIQQAYKYRIESVDSCGLTNYSDAHQTIHLLTSVNPVTNFPQLSWSSYVGYNYNTYYIYRGTSPTNVALYDSLSSSFTTYTDVNPIAGNIYYAVAINTPSSCSYLGSSKSGSLKSFSNYSPVNVVSINENNLDLRFEIYPNPAKKLLTITFGANFVSGELILFDIYGRELMKKEINNSNKETFNINKLSKGYYIAIIKSEEGLFRKKFIKN